METSTAITARQPWNKGKLVGQKTPLKLKEIWAIRIRLQIASRCRDLALFNLAVDSKLRACDLMQLRVRDVCHGQSMASRALILQQKTSRPVQFEITEPARTAVSAWISHSNLKGEDFLFPSRIHASPHLSTRQYARIVDSWVQQLGLDTTSYGTHTLRRTKATLICRSIKNLRALPCRHADKGCAAQSRANESFRPRTAARGCRLSGIRNGLRMVDSDGPLPGCSSEVRSTWPRAGAATP